MRSIPPRLLWSFEASWQGGFEGLLGSSSGVFGASWAVLGSSWDRLGASCGILGSLLGCLRGCLGEGGGDVSPTFHRRSSRHFFFNFWPDTASKRAPKSIKIRLRSQKNLNVFGRRFLFGLAPQLSTQHQPKSFKHLCQETQKSIQRNIQKMMHLRIDF